MLEQSLMSVCLMDGDSNGGDDGMMVLHSNDLNNTHCAENPAAGSPSHTSPRVLSVTGAMGRYGPGAQEGGGDGGGDGDDGDGAVGWCGPGAHGRVTSCLQGLQLPITNYSC